LIFQLPLLHLLQLLPLVATVVDAVVDAVVDFSTTVINY
jgi:hypothetical protein